MKTEKSTFRILFYLKRTKTLNKNNTEPNEMMNTVNAEYDKLMMVLGDSKPIEAVKENVPLSDKLKELMGKVDTSELSLEVCGSWLWVTKKTFPIKDLLKSLGFRYSANKMAWYYRSNDSRSDNQSPCVSLFYNSLV